MNARQLSTVLLVALCLLGYAYATPASLANDSSAENQPTSPEIEESEIDLIEPMSQAEIINQVCKGVRLSDAFFACCKHPYVQLRPYIWIYSTRAVCDHTKTVGMRLDRRPHN